MANNIVTIDSLSNDYKGYLQAENPKFNPYGGVNTFFDIDAGAMGAILLDLYMNLQIIQNNIYPQNAVGTAVDQWLYSEGLPARGGLTYSTIIVEVTSTGGASTLPINTIFTDTATLNTPPKNFTNNQYQTLIPNIAITTGTTLTLTALQVGSNYIEPVDNRLSAQVDGDTVIVTVQSCQNGQEQETDQSCVNRILEARRTPRAGARATDYSVYALASDPGVITDSIVLPGYVIIGGVKVLGVFVLVGIAITEYQLDQGLSSGSFSAYSREAAGSIVTIARDYITNLKLVGLNTTVGTSLTTNVFTDLSPLNIEVALVSPYTLDTEIYINTQNSDSSPATILLSVEEIIKREARRAICNQPFGGVLIGDSLYITMSSIVEAVNSQLSYQNGNLTQILTNIIISNPDQPGGTQDSSNISYIFDIESYDSIIVSQQVSL